MIPMERHCGWLLRAYPAWYRRERAGEMLGTLLEASPPGARWPSFRDARALMIGGLRVRGWTWLLLMAWVAIGAGGAIYGTVTVSHRGYDQGVMWMTQWPGEPQLIIDVAVVALPVWALLSGPVLLAGIVRLRGCRRTGLRAVGWTSSWVAGLVLMNQTADFVRAGEYGAPGAFLGVGEMAICVAWLVLGGAMTWILCGPQARPDGSSSNSSVAAS